MIPDCAGNGENARLRALPIAIGSAARHKNWHRCWTPPTLALLAAAAARSQWKTTILWPENANFIPLRARVNLGVNYQLTAPNWPVNIGIVNCQLQLIADRDQLAPVN